MRWIDHEVVEHARWAAERHVILSLNAGVAISQHNAGPLRDEHQGVLPTKFTAEEGGVCVLGRGGGRKESVRIEVVVLRDKQGAKSTDCP